MQMIDLLPHKIDIYQDCKYPRRAIMDFCLHIVEIHDFISLPTLHIIRVRNKWNKRRNITTKILQEDNLIGHI